MEGSSRCIRGFRFIGLPILVCKIMEADYSCKFEKLGNFSDIFIVVYFIFFPLWILILGNLHFMNLDNLENLDCTD